LRLRERSLPREPDRRSSPNCAPRTTGARRPSTGGSTPPLPQRTRRECAPTPNAGFCSLGTMRKLAAPKASLRSATVMAALRSADPSRAERSSRCCRTRWSVASTRTSEVQVEQLRVVRVDRVDTRAAPTSSRYGRHGRRKARSRSSRGSARVRPARHRARAARIVPGEVAPRGPAMPRGRRASGRTRLGSPCTSGMAVLASRVRRGAPTDSLLPDSPTAAGISHPGPRDMSGTSPRSTKRGRSPRPPRIRAWPPTT